MHSLARGAASASNGSQESPFSVTRTTSATSPLRVHPTRSVGRTSGLVLVGNPESGKAIHETTKFANQISAPEIYQLLLPGDLHRVPSRRRFPLRHFEIFERSSFYELGRLLLTYALRLDRVAGNFNWIPFDS